MKHKYLVITLDKEYDTSDTHSLASAIMELKKVNGVQAVKEKPSKQSE